MITLVLKYRNFLLYGIIGAISAGFDFIVYSLLTCISIDILISNVISVHCGMLCSFILNREFNFRVKDKVGHRFIRFYLIDLLGLAISTGALYLAVNQFNLDPKLSKLCTIGVVACFQFVLTKLIIFKR